MSPLSVCKQPFNSVPCLSLELVLQTESARKFIVMTQPERAPTLSHHYLLAAGGETTGAAYGRG
jgi:hypothetical protein